MNIHVEGRDGLTEAASRRVGTILNRKWRLDSLLGVGGTAAVYAATHRNGHRVAIKVLHAHFSLDEAIRARLSQEGYAANLIEHPGAVRILDDDQAEDGAVFMVMELLAGESLDARLKRKGWRLPRGEALGIVHALLDVLAAAHNKGVIHRDIKPDNVFVTREGQIKVLDFGIARVLDLPQNLTRTRNGTLFGTLGFMAPEQALGRTHEIDARTDLWSVGATLFTLLSGRLVHEAPTPNEQLVNAATRSAPALTSVLPDADAPLAALVDKALAFHQADRWQNAFEMQEAVRTLVVATSGPMGVPVLQGPRLSVEVDLAAINEVRGRWASSSLRPSMVRPLSLPAPSLVVPPARRWVKRIALGAAAALTLTTGVMIERARSVMTEPSAPLVAPGRTGAPSLSEQAMAAVQDLPPPPVAAAEITPMATKLAAVAEPPATRPRRRQSRRVVRAVPRASTPAAPSVADNDALWGKRY